jgi:hypothetical protein
MKRLYALILILAFLCVGNVIQPKSVSADTVPTFTYNTYLTTVSSEDSTVMVVCTAENANRHYGCALLVSMFPNTMSTSNHYTYYKIYNNGSFIYEGVTYKRMGTEMLWDTLEDWNGLFNYDFILVTRTEDNQYSYSFWMR